MNRFFGGKKNQQGQSLDGAIDLMNKQSDNVESKINKLNQELQVIKSQMEKAKTPSAKNILKTKALRLLKQKKMYEQNHERLQQHAFNMDNVNYATQSAQNVVMMTGALKSGLNVMKSYKKQMRIGDLENLTDDVMEMLEDVNEVNDILSEINGGEQVNEEDLLAELDGLEDMCFEETNNTNILDTIGIGQTPMISEERQKINAPKLQEKERTKLDEFGLPLE